jgi:hypothetical protein
VPGLSGSNVLVNVQAWDRYDYSFNSPANFVDPDGHEPKGPDGCYEPGDPGCGELPKPSPVEPQQDEETVTLPSPSEVAQEDLMADEYPVEDSVDWLAAGIGVTLILGGGLFFIIAAQATTIAISTMQLEIAAPAAMIAVGSGLVVYGGIRMIISSGLVPGTERKRP